MLNITPLRPARRHDSKFLRINSIDFLLDGSELLSLRSEHLYALKVNRNYTVNRRPNGISGIFV